MKNKLRIMIDHIVNNMDSQECKCRLCEMQEKGTFIDGLIEAISLIKS